jgi:hypothetical protein
VFETKILKAAIALSAILFSAAWPQAAGAVTFITPSASVLVAQANATPLSPGIYLTNGYRYVQPGAQFDDYFAFTTTQSLATTTTASVLEANPVLNGPFGVVGLTVEWLGLGSAAAFTDSNGVLNASASLVATLTSGGPYLLHVFGTALADGGLYSLRLTASEAPSPVPLPPTIILLGTVLGGFAVTRLRRRGHLRS